MLLICGLPWYTSYQLFALSHILSVVCLAAGVHDASTGHD